MNLCDTHDVCESSERSLNIELSKLSTTNVECVCQSLLLRSMDVKKTPAMSPAMESNVAIKKSKDQLESLMIYAAPNGMISVIMVAKVLPTPM